LRRAVRAEATVSIHG